MGRKHRKANNAVAPELLQCDLATSRGLIRMAEGLVRQFAAGGIEQRRFEALMSGLEVIASLRRQFQGSQESGASSSDGMPPKKSSDAERAAGRVAVNGSRINAARESSAYQQPRSVAANGMPTHKNGTPQVAPKLIKRRDALQRRRQTLDFVNAFASEVAAAKPIVSHLQSTAKLRPIRPDVLDTIPKSFL